MCDYCGCQEVPAIAALTAEHDEIRAVARVAAAAARADDRAAAADAANTLLRLLTPHTQIEEQGLFPVMAGEFAEHVASLEDDHERIETALARVAEPSSDNPRWADELDAALAELFVHILREQDGLFPATLSVFAADDWENMDGVRARIVAQRAASVPA